MKSRPLCFATSNKGKIAEIKAVFPDAEFVPLPSTCVEVQPKGFTLKESIEVAEQKARSAFLVIGKSVIIEDSALCIDSLDGFPASLVKFSTETLKQRQALCRSIPANLSRNAEAYCILAWHDGISVKHALGSVKGKIALSPESTYGDNPFGWDDIFIPEGESRTYFNLTKEYKLRFSMRTKALQNIES